MATQENEPAPLPVVVILEADLFFLPRLTDVVCACGALPVVTEAPVEFLAAVDRHFPVVAFVDLATPGDWPAAIQRCKLRPHTRAIPIYAFGSHVDTATLQTARRAGADHAWARSKFMAELPAIVAQHVHPPVVYPDGWDAPLSELARQGIEVFNHGEYFEQHEFLEAAWLAEVRPVREMYQGILQVGVAFLQIERNNWPGALKLLRRGLPRLRTLPPVCQGVDIASFRAAAAAIHAEVTALGPERLGEFDRTRLPKIVVIDAARIA
jgi:hypothetical protein